MKFTNPGSGFSEMDEQLMLREYRRTGDLYLLGKLYGQYMHLVYGLCLKYFKDEEHSKDAVMQIFEQLVDKLRIHEVTHFKSWLYTLARNYCLMALRASSKYEVLRMDENFMENEAVVHLDIDDTKERKLNVLEACLEKLPPEQQKAVRLFYLEEKCYKDIAEITGYDLNKVKSYIQNGKRNLKICIEKNEK